MSAIPRSTRLSSHGQVVAILVASAAVWLAILAAVGFLFITIFIPAVTLGGKGDIPRDFPVYPGAHLQSAIATRFGDCTTVSATWSASMSAAPVVAFYKSQLASGSWSLTDSREHIDSVELFFESVSYPHREGVVTISSEPYDRSTTLISLELDKSRGAPAGGCQLLVGRADAAVVARNRTAA